jgi:hypothetical protein
MACCSIQGAFHAIDVKQGTKSISIPLSDAHLQEWISEYQQVGYVLTCVGVP